MLIPIIVAWYRALPPERKYLFGGLKVGWEASINVNAYYYPDGNRILEQWPDDESRDPQGHDPAKGGHSVLRRSATRRRARRASSAAER